MSERSERISRLLNSQQSRVSYIKAKLSVLVPAQIRSLRLRATNPPMPYQRDLAQETDLHQSRISMFETPGMSNMTLETLAKVGAGLRCGVIVRFVPFSEMLTWENNFSPDQFDVVRIDCDEAFLHPPDEPYGIGASINKRVTVLTNTAGSAFVAVSNEGELGSLPTPLPPTGSQATTDLEELVQNVE